MDSLVTLPSGAITRGLPTSLDTQGSSGTQQWADSPWKHNHNAKVARHLQELWPTRAAAMRDCGKTGVNMACRGCGTPYVFPYRCSARTCPVCARKAAAAIVDRLMARVSVHDLIMEEEPWDGPGARQRRGWRHLVLTIPTCVEIEPRFDSRRLRSDVLRARSAFRKFWRQTTWGRQVRDPDARQKHSRRDTSYVVALEVSLRGLVHLHSLIYGEFVPQAILQHHWSAVLGRTAICHITAAGTPNNLGKALREVLKYATKGETGVRDQAGRAASVELAFRDVKRISVGGALRGIKVDKQDGSTDDARPEDLHDERRAVCEACGVVGDFCWLGTVSQADVARNGGFGRFLIQRSPDVRSGATDGATTRHPDPFPGQLRSLVSSALHSDRLQFNAGNNFTLSPQWSPSTEGETSP